ncbi:MAG: LamG-like jellyroll fold domain-containing protein [Vicingaceae bacterium]
MRRIISSLILIFISFTLNSQNLIAHYPLDTNGNDISGNSLHATVTGGTSANDRNSNANQAMNFSAGGKMEVSDTSYFNFGLRGEITIAAWFKISTTKTYSSIAITGTASWVPGMAFGVNWETDKLLFGVGSNSGAAGSIGVFSKMSVNDGAWHHGLVTVNTTTNQMKMFIDGNLVKIDKYNAFGTTGGSISSDSTYLDITGLNFVNSPTTLLVMGNSPWSQNFDGDLDEIMFFDGAVSDVQVQQIYNGIPLGVINDMISNSLNVFPNPTSGELNIVSDNSVRKIEIFNTTGQMVYTKNIGTKTAGLNLQLESGMYVMRIFEESKVLSGRLMIK